MNARIILVPTDFSTIGQTALDTATALARDKGAKLLIVHVQEPSLAYGGGEFYYGIEEPNLRDLQTMLQEVVPGDPLVAYEHRLMTGIPAEVIVHLAETEKADMIVLATHGRTGLSRLLMGSVAEAVVRNARCPVLSVKATIPKPVKA